MAQPSAPPVSPITAIEYIDRRRACCILGVSLRTLERLAARGQIGYIDLSKKSHKRLHYQSLVYFCDRLRQKHKIADRRPVLAASYLRHRDEDLLPFPLADTIRAEEACELLGFRRLQPVVRLIEEGKFEAYQMAAQAPWRISRSSLYNFMREVSRPVPDHPLRYRLPATSPHF